MILIRANVSLSYGLLLSVRLLALSLVLDFSPNQHGEKFYGIIHYAGKDYEIYRLKIKSNIYLFLLEHLSFL